MIDKKTSLVSPESFTTFGELLKYLRRRAGLTQRDLGLEVGYSEPQISFLEKNHRLPDVTTVSARFVPALDLEYDSPLARRLIQLAEASHIENQPIAGAPYKGLQFFDVQDAHLFYGRELLTARLVRLLRKQQFLAIVVGASGSGKSSIVRAGLVPALQRGQRLADGGAELLKLTGHTGTVVSLSFSPDGTQLATTGRDGMTKLWDADSGELLLNLYGNGEGLIGVAFSPDGQRLITIGSESIHIYLVRLEDLIALARTRLTRSLTEDECLQYLHMNQCPAKSP